MTCGTCSFHLGWWGVSLAWFTTCSRGPPSQWCTPSPPTCSGPSPWTSCSAMISAVLAGLMSSLLLFSLVWCWRIAWIVAKLAPASLLGKEDEGSWLKLLLIHDPGAKTWCQTPLCHKKPESAKIAAVFYWPFLSEQRMRQKMRGIWTNQLTLRTLYMWK